MEHKIVTTMANEPKLMPCRKPIDKSKKSNWRCASCGNWVNLVHKEGSKSHQLPQGYGKTAKFARHEPLPECVVLHETEEPNTFMIEEVEK